MSILSDTQGTVICTGTAMPQYYGVAPWGMYPANLLQAAAAATAQGSPGVSTAGGGGGGPGPGPAGSPNHVPQSRRALSPSQTASSPVDVLAAAAAAAGQAWTYFS